MANISSSNLGINSKIWYSLGNKLKNLYVKFHFDRFSGLSGNLDTTKIFGVPIIQLALLIRIIFRKLIPRISLLTQFAYFASTICWWIQWKKKLCGVTYVSSTPSCGKAANKIPVRCNAVTALLLDSWSHPIRMTKQNVFPTPSNPKNPGIVGWFCWAPNCIEFPQTETSKSDRWSSYKFFRPFPWLSIASL